MIVGDMVLIVVIIVVVVVSAHDVGVAGVNCAPGVVVCVFTVVMSIVVSTIGLTV